MGRRRTETVLVTKVTGLAGDGAAGAVTLRRQPDELIVEEPMSIQLDGTLVATTMRTPGHDYELAVGFCFTDGLLGGAHVTGVRYCATGPAAESEFNVVTVETGGLAPPPTPRLGTTTSSCGLCGSATLDELRTRLAPLPADRTVRFPVDLLAEIPGRVQASQALFASTGAVHAAAAFTESGEVVLTREDVGRHNAVDKVVGRLLLDGRPAGPSARALRLRPGELRDRAEGVGGRLRRGRRGERADGARRRHGAGGGHVARRFRPTRSPQRVRARTGGVNAPGGPARRTR